MKPYGIVVIITACAVAVPGVVSGKDVRSPIAVLTPAVPDKWVVYAGDLLVPAQSLFDGQKNDEVEKLAESAGFSIAERLTAQTLDAFRSAGWDAAALQRSRPPVSAPVRREEYPADTGGRIMLDMKVQLVGLVAGWGRLSPYRPVINVSYRLLDSKGRPQSLAKAVYYCYSDLQCVQGATPQRMVAGDESADCAFATMSTIKKESARLWSCLDTAFLRIGEKIVADQQ